MCTETNRRKDCTCGAPKLCLQNELFNLYALHVTANKTNKPKRECCLTKSNHVKQNRKLELR